MIVNQTQANLKHQKHFFKEHVLSGTKQLNGQDSMSENVPPQGTMKIAFIKNASMGSKFKRNETLSVWRISYPFSSEDSVCNNLYVLVDNEARSVCVSISDEHFDAASFLQPSCLFTEIPMKENMVNFPKVEASMSKPLKETPLGPAGLSVQVELRVTDDLNVLQVWIILAGGLCRPDLISLDEPLTVVPQTMTPPTVAPPSPAQSGSDSDTTQSSVADPLEELRTFRRALESGEMREEMQLLQIEELRMLRTALENGEIREEMQLLGQAIAGSLPQAGASGALPGNFRVGDAVICLTGPHEFEGGRGISKYEVGAVIGSATSEPGIRVRCQFPREPSTNVLACEIALRKSVGNGMLVGDRVRSLVAASSWTPIALDVGDAGTIVSALDGFKARVDFGHVTGTCHCTEVCKAEEYCCAGLKVQDQVKAKQEQTPVSFDSNISLVCLGDVGEVLAVVPEFPELVQCRFPNALSVNVPASSLERSVGGGLFVGDAVESLVSVESGDNSLREGDTGTIVGTAWETLQPSPKIKVEIGNRNWLMFAREVRKVGTQAAPPAA